MADHLRLEEAALLRELRRDALEARANEAGQTWVDDEWVDDADAQEAFAHFIGMTEDRL